MDPFAAFRHIIVWGFPLHSHTHSYIHGAWIAAFKHLGHSVHWFHDGDPGPVGFDFSNCMFITEGWADAKIPLRADCTYFVHIAANPAKYLDIGARLIEIRYNVTELHDYNYDYVLPQRGIHLSPQTIYERVADDSAVATRRGRPIQKTPYEVVYMYWATDLLPHEFNYDDAAITRDPMIFYIGSVSGANHPFHKFKAAAESSNLLVTHIDPWKNPVDYEMNRILMKASYAAPDFRTHGDDDKHAQYGKYNGTNHLDIGYIPCRVFKAISYGHTGITNSKRVKEILGEHVEYAPNPEDVLPIVERRKNDVEWRRQAMRHVAEHHTFVQRARDLGRALQQPKTNKATVVTAVYDIGRQAVDGRSPADYKQWLTKTLQAIKDPMIVYLDETLGWKQHILEVRNTVGPTIVIEGKLRDLQMMRWRSRIAEIHAARAAHVKHPRDITNLLPEYCIIQYNKFYFLEDAFATNPFASDHILWVDAGFSRFLPADTQYTFTGSTALFALQADELPPSSLTFENYVETNQCILHGWLWVVRSAAALRAVMDQVFTVWDRMMTDGRLDNEQIALALGYRANPAVFDARVVRGDGAIFHQFFSAHK